MSENATEAVETTEVESPEVDTVVIPDSPLVVAGRAEYENYAAEANKLFSQVEAVENVNATIAEIRNTSTDERIVAFREWKDKADKAILARESEIDAIIKAEMVSAEPVDVDKVKAAHKELVKKAKDLATVLRNFAGEAAVHKLPALKSISGRAVSTSSGSGGKRPRLQSVTVDGEKVFATVDNKDGTKTEVASFTVLAAYINKDNKGCIKVEPKDLQEAAFAAAKTDDLSTLAGQPVSFPFTVSKAKEDGTKEYMRTYAEIVVIPRVPEN